MSINTRVSLPAWAIGILVTVILALFSWGIATASNSASTRTQVQITKEDVVELKVTDKLLQETKADKEDIEEVKAALIRIEAKIDARTQK